VVDGSGLENQRG